MIDCCPDMWVWLLVVSWWGQCRCPVGCGVPLAMLGGISVYVVSLVWPCRSTCVGQFCLECEIVVGACLVKCAILLGWRVWLDESARFLQGVVFEMKTSLQSIFFLVRL